MKKFTLFFILIISLFLAACNMPQYKWANSSYSPTMVEQNLVIDQGDCNGDSEAVFPLPVAMRSPDLVFRQCIARPFVKTSVFLRPDYAAYVYNSPGLMKAYANRNDRNLSVEVWGERNYLNNGRARGRNVPTKRLVTYPVCNRFKDIQQYQYNEYSRIVSSQRSNRREYVSNCMAQLGWQLKLVEEPSRLIIERHANGQKSKEGNIINGKSEGLWTEWDESGNVVSQGNYLIGKKDGPWIEYWGNGNKRNERMFDNGNQQDETHWDEEENICSEQC
jgi:hypothetical protein